MHRVDYCGDAAPQPNVHFPPIAVIGGAGHKPEMKSPISTRFAQLFPVLSKVALFLAGAYYTGYITKLFETELGWHTAPVGLLMLLGTAFISDWAGRRLEAWGASQS